MEKHYIEFKGKEYKVEEPTIALWGKLNSLKELYDDNDFSILIISLATGLSTDQLRESSWQGVYETASYLSSYLLKDGDKFYNEFEFRNRKYRFIDLENLTFGEFIDIDEFLSRDPSQKISDLNHLMALLYREVDTNGKMTPYDASLLSGRSELFKQLPVKYLRGSMVFFYNLETILQRNTRSSFHRIRTRVRWELKKLLRAFGVGMRHSYTYLMTISYKFIKLLRDRFSRSSTTSPTKKTSAHSGTEK